MDCHLNLKELSIKICLWDRCRVHTHPKNFHMCWIRKILIAPSSFYLTEQCFALSKNALSPISEHHTALSRSDLIGPVWEQLTNHVDHNHQSCWASLCLYFACSALWCLFDNTWWRSLLDQYVALLNKISRELSVHCVDLLSDIWHTLSLRNRITSAQ